MDGEYTQWGAFTPCTTSCGNGIQTRSRNCTDPAPLHGGKYCDGSSKHQQQCKLMECPIDGGLTEWSPFTSCSKSCGKGSQERTRTCTSPPPQHGGDDCVGEDDQIRECKVKECPGRFYICSSIILHF